VVFSGYSTNKTDRHDITEILLKVAFITIILTLLSLFYLWFFRSYSYKHGFFVRKETYDFQGSCRITPEEPKVKQ
jgi:hypothetical protein